MNDPLRAKAEAIVRDIMNHHTDRPAERLVLIDRNGRDQGGWGFLPLVDRIHKHLLEMEEERKS